MSNAFVERLLGRGPLDTEEIAMISAACRNERAVVAGHHLIREGDKPDPVFVVLEGWAIRYKILPDGGRQVIAFMLPGDFCDIHIDVLDAMDHSVVTITEARVALIPRAQMEELVSSRHNLTRAFWWAQLVDHGVSRAWIISIGRRTSTERVAHLMCELYIRMRNIGLATHDRCEMPITQIVLADALGLTPVHVNRVLRQLRLAKIMVLRSGSLTILDPPSLARIAGFDDAYLHGRITAAATRDPAEFQAPGPLAGPKALQARR